MYSAQIAQLQLHCSIHAEPVHFWPACSCAGELAITAGGCTGGGSSADQAAAGHRRRQHQLPRPQVCFSMPALLRLLRQWSLLRGCSSRAMSGTDCTHGLRSIVFLCCLVSKRFCVRSSQHCGVCVQPSAQAGVQPPAQAAALPFARPPPDPDALAHQKAPQVSQQHTLTAARTSHPRRCTCISSQPDVDDIK